MNLTMIAAGLRLIADGLEESEAKAPSTKRQLPPIASHESGDPVDDQPAETKPKAKEVEADDPPFETGDEKPPTLQDLQNLGARLIKAGKRREFLDLIADAGVKNLSAIPEADYPAFHAKAKALDDD